MISRLSRYCPGDHIKKNEMGGACSTYGGEEMCIQGFGGETWGERDHLGDPGVNGMSIRMDPKETGWGDMGSINLA